MRLWSIHPEYLDAKGLVALWREALLAQKVLTGMTKGYTRHPQLLRFKNQSNPLGAIGCYLTHVWNEANQRGYQFNRHLIRFPDWAQPAIPVTEGQIDYETIHLREKLAVRCPKRAPRLWENEEIELHPLFKRIPGPIEDFETGSRDEPFSL